jgi:hypothetical protein
MAKLTKTSTPGIFRRHRQDCPGGRCECAYAVVWRHRGRQSMETFPTLAAEREAKARREAGERRPASREPFEDYARLLALARQLRIASVVSAAMEPLLA